MSMIRNKLREKNGASIFMGLIFLMVCLMVGTVVLTASTAAAGKLAQQRQNEQAYLTVASAARLVKDRICALTYTYEVTTTRHSDGTPGSSSSTKDLTASDGGEVILEKELKELCGDLSGSGETSFQIGRALETSAVKWETVYGSLRVETDGRILVELWLGEKDKDSSKDHDRIKIEFSPEGPVTSTEITSVEDPPGTITETTVATTTCRWPESGCTIAKG